MTKDEPFIRQCITLSEQAVRLGDEPFGALLVVDGEVRLTAQNRAVTEADPTRHAELLLASEACRRLDRSTLARATLYTSTEPCVMCCGAIYWSRIPRMVYGCSAVELGALVGGSLVIPSRQVLGGGKRPIEVVGPVLEAEALAVHRAYWPAL
ncbi:MAG: tRNA-specific adenosine deaminase [Acidobacteria bacterium]|jgi:tRNA(Arg) A34 adenosine deaminase TadA|nr:tRNA-specific adenosine deaminase [Acidobacteriota bacterium]MDP7339770.1 nucleoside deaminase [Vicinamibacterales bacterium]MDP7477898.1 nucleoside deaminase [Vicinamibacterales bacterium]MDP7692176.1 nucleoside deaminase [Vicinamibacterales bacterium]HJN44614.1 nucleoside deaminase [Vicinamibacterales bacterium]